jgi:SAM-dependent methyltransferase
VPVIRSSDYHDYVIKDGKFIGEFEQMYQHVADPWRCVEQADAFKNQLLLGAVRHVEGDVKRALDIGCGLGALTTRLRQALPGAEWHACDVSSTAVERASQEDRAVHFFVHDLSRPEPLPFEPGSLDLITMAEVMWYVLPHMSGIFAHIHRLLRPGGHLLVLQYFLRPEEQQYGKEIVSSPADLLRFVRQAGFEIRQEVYVGAKPPQDLLLWATKAA